MKIFMLLVFMFTFAFADGHATNYENPFQIVYGGIGNNIYGNYATISSSVECVKKQDGGCNDNYNGYLFYTNTKYINSDNTIPLNSSTKTLQLPSDINGSDVVYAGLYWQGHVAGTNANDYNTTSMMQNENKVDLIDPNGVLHNITADKLWYLNFWGDGGGSNGGYRSFYQGYKNITSIVQNSYNTNHINNFTVGDIKANEGKDHSQYAWVNDKSYQGFKFGYWGSWTIVVVYKYPNIATMNPRPKPKNITLFQGFQPLIPISNSGGDVTSSIQLPLSGFLTPGQTPVNASMFIYGTGGDRKLSYDSLQIQDKKTSQFANISNAANPSNDAFNDTISNSNSTSAGNYYVGLDADEFNVSNFMTTFQTQTTLKLSAKFIRNSGDQFFPGFIAFSTDLYEPSFCYDYSYEQNGIFFTQPNNGTQDPRLAGTVTPGQPIGMKIFLKNLVSSTINVTDMNLSVVDINTTQVNYINDNNSTQLTPPGSLFAQPVSPVVDSNGSYATDIHVGTVPALEYMYLYYHLNPKINDLNTSINVVANYNLHVGSATIPYSLKLGSQIPMCSSGNFSYNPAYGIFDIVDNKYYSTTSTSPRFYNIPTQVTSRDGNFKIISLNPNSLNQLKPQSTMVAVDMINAQAFHDVNASCDEPDSAISPKVWVLLNNTDSAPFNQAALQSAINNNMTSLTNSNEFYQQARRNAAFRIEYNTEANGSLINVTTLSSGRYKLTNFPNYGGDHCSSPNEQQTVSSVCGSNGQGGGSNGMTKAELASCMQCIYGYHTKFVCSRDNFAIRPEAFYIKISDENQTHPSSQQLIATNAQSNAIVNLASGYDYNLTVVATNHQNNNASPMFYEALNNTLDDNASYNWNPGTQNVNGCNDTTNHNINVGFINGVADMNTSLSQVGRYLLNMVDSTWTAVDHDPADMTHHTGQYFKTGADCALNSSAVIATNGSGLNGCNISSDENNTLTNVHYQNIPIEFHPYKFDLTTIVPSLGLNHNISDFNTPNSFVYMSNINKPADENMSFHLNGQIKAEGENNVTLSNFVSQCYAQPIDVNISKTAITIPPSFEYIFHDENSSGQYDSNTTGTMNTPLGTISLSDGNFTKNLNGAISEILNLNFDRNQTIPENPQRVTFDNLAVGCQIPANCSYHGDLTTKSTTGLLDLNKTVTFYYARAHAPDYKYQGNSGSGKIYYEIYDNNATIKVLLPDGINTPVGVDSINWYQNSNNTVLKDGGVTQLQEHINPPNVTVTTEPTATSPANFSLNYDGSQGYPYQTTMQITPSPWLVYNPYNPTTTTNNFNVGFYKALNNWVGVEDTNTSTDSNASTITNQRILW